MVVFYANPLIYDENWKIKETKNDIDYYNELKNLDQII